jgi:hypothetical protein
MHAIRTAITLSLALTFPTTGAFAADLTGSKCKTVNQTKIILGKEYKCVKQAGKKTWRQLIVPTQVAYSNLSKEEAEVYNLLDKQIAQLNSQLNAGVAPKINFITDNSNNSRGKEIEVASKTASKILNGFKNQMPDFDIYAWESLDWVKGKLNATCPSLADQTTKNSGGAVGCGKMFADNLNGWMNIMGPPHASWYESAHETFHIAQYNWAFDVNRPTESRFYENSTAWYREGSASVFGGMVASLLSNGSRNYGSTTAFEGSPYKYLVCKDPWNTWKISNKTEGFGVFKDCEYGAGRRIMDLLVAKHGGVAALLNFYAELGKGANFETAFEKAHGINLKDFFTEAEAYLDGLGWKK